MVGPAGFEPATSCSQSKRATKLRYGPVIMPFGTTFLVYTYLKTVCASRCLIFDVQISRENRRSAVIVTECYWRSFFSFF